MVRWSSNHACVFVLTSISFQIKHKCLHINKIQTILEIQEKPLTFLEKSSGKKTCQNHTALLPQQAKTLRSMKAEKEIQPEENKKVFPTEEATVSLEEKKKTSLAIIGGGAAGFFLAVNAKEMMPELDVTIFEQQRKVLVKVEISGGGRCNCTNTFAEISDLKQAYPRGASLLKRLFQQFGPSDAFQWFENHGVPLTIQEDQCVFPKAQDSHAIIDCLTHECKRHHVRLRLGIKIEQPEDLLKEFDYVAVTIGGTPHREGCVPSLFTFSIKDKALTSLMGTVVEEAIVSIPSTKFKAEGPLLITHWGMSGPAILKLSSYAARHLAEQGYQSPLLVNWTGNNNAEDAYQHIIYNIERNPQKKIENIKLFNLQDRLWNYLLSKTQLQGKRCQELGKKGINRLVDLLTNDTYFIAGRSVYKDEFVTCGGVALDQINAHTLESKSIPGLFYAGEVLDIDGITGGFNFQAAWATAYAVAKAISEKNASFPHEK